MPSLQSKAGGSLSPKVLLQSATLGFSVLNNKPKIKCHSVRVSLAALLPKALLSSGRNLLNASLAAQAKMQKKKSNGELTGRRLSVAQSVFLSVAGIQPSLSLSSFSVKNQEKLLPRLCPFKTDGVTNDFFGLRRTSTALLSREAKGFCSMSPSLQRTQGARGHV